MKKIWSVLIILSVSFKAQVGFFDSYFMFTQKDFYNLNEGISHSTYEDGDYKKTIELLQSDYYRSNPEPAFYINSLLTYNTKGKDAAFEMVSKSSYSNEKKEFLKLWLTYFSEFRDDYKILFSAFEKKYPDNPEFFKFKTYLETKEYSKLFGNSKEFCETFYKKMDEAIANSKFSEENKMFFRLAKLDIKDFKEEYEEAKKMRIDTLYNLWKGNKNLFSYKGLEKTISGCENSKCMEMNAWILTEERNTEKNIYSAEEEILGKLIAQEKEGNKGIPVAELENTLELFLSKLDDGKKEDFKALLSIYFLDKEINFGIMMKGLFNPIPFSMNFRKKYQSLLTKEQIVSRMKQMSEDPKYTNAFNEGAIVKFQKEIDKLKVYGIDDLRAMYGLLVFSNYYGGLLSKSFEKIGMRTNHPSEKQNANYKEFLKFYDENPMYNKKDLYFDGMITDVRTYADLQDFISGTDALIVKYKGSLPIRSMALQMIGWKKNLVPKEKYQEYLSMFFIRLVDLYDEIQSVYFDNNDYMLLTNIVLEGDQRYNYPIYNDFYKLFSNDNLEKGYQYLLKKSKAKPHQNNLKAFSESLNNFIIKH
ncbi:hypothetical protein HNP38_002908 [Chryseobacterium defluvii]|uniref:Uncharacterized protein n=1 Tax=Chryseobacterium defluvii TaxID=160396 RepID=A0A840KL57_9FLAO|nr:hypothetical protein [Chryseobacterium defluvii]MBB4807602.1 hypothetical protein [Chryseobacterium defluvii]